ncbi:MAG: 4-(cytidine 5'-diphospho)-2-C-methyl-D-erythritol kinase [Pirellulaceae bacterium]|nr:4-(cytidine 5'-diphospho)-2-C-methyl-D-erythritol kinase [Pirellulaceae bacterium]
MFLRRTPSALVVQTPAKLNLHFEVLARRADGFHDVETVMVAVDLFDTLIFCSGTEPFEMAQDDVPGSPAKSTTHGLSSADGHSKGNIQFRSSWAVGLRAGRSGHELTEMLGDLPCDSDNLVVRAIRLLEERSGVAFPSDVMVQLVKRIPAAAGLGGGSSNAAAALLGANELLDLRWSRERLADLAAELGSDIPFFLSTGAAVCRGRGEQIESHAGWPPLHFVIVRPPFGLDTAKVYADCTPAARPVSAKPMLDLLKQGNPIGVGQRLFNRLEEPAMRLQPGIGQIKQWMRQLGLPGQQLTGSGSSYFAVCRNRAQARRAAKQLRGYALGHVFAVSSWSMPLLNV